MQKCRAVQSALSPKAALPLSTPVRAQPHIQRRNLQDVFITRTGNPIIKVQGGRYVFISPGVTSMGTLSLTSELSLGRLSEVCFAGKIYAIERL